MPDDNVSDGYINYFDILGLSTDAKRGEVRREYQHKMKKLLVEIAATEITEERRAHFLLEIAKANAAFYTLFDNEHREAYWTEREALIDLEKRWSKAALQDEKEAEPLRREFDRRLRDFLAKYVEEAMLAAGREKECVETSRWDEAHERHAFRILRRYRQSLYQSILERLPYVEVTPPVIDWDERARFAKSLIGEETV